MSGTQPPTHLGFLSFLGPYWTMGLEMSNDPPKMVEARGQKQGVPSIIPGAKQRGGTGTASSILSAFKRTQ